MVGAERQKTQQHIQTSDPIFQPKTAQSQTEQHPFPQKQYSSNQRALQKIGIQTNTKTNQIIPLADKHSSLPNIAQQQNQENPYLLQRKAFHADFGKPYTHNAPQTNCQSSVIQRRFVLTQQHPKVQELSEPETLEQTQRPANLDPEHTANTTNGMGLPDALKTSVVQRQNQYTQQQFNPHQRLTIQPKLLLESVRK